MAVSIVVAASMMVERSGPFVGALGDAQPARTPELNRNLAH